LTDSIPSEKFQIRLPSNGNRDAMWSRAVAGNDRRHSLYLHAVPQRGTIYTKRA
jgi:hypothetical protein